MMDSIPRANLNESGGGSLATLVVEPVFERLCPFWFWRVERDAARCARGGTGFHSAGVLTCQAFDGRFRSPVALAMRTPSVYDGGVVPLDRVDVLRVVAAGNPARRLHPPGDEPQSLGSDACPAHAYLAVTAANAPKALAAASSRSRSRMSAVSWHT